MFTFWKSDKPKREQTQGEAGQCKEALARSSMIEGATGEVEASFLTDAGCRRELNEDCGQFIKPADPGLLADKGVLAVVADGMGGHAAGEVASLLAVEVITSSYYGSGQEVEPALKEALLLANRTIYSAASGNSSLEGMGTTCTALVLRQGLAFLAHVGDSRLYLVRGGEIYQLSEDHSVVAEMMKRGLLSESEARLHADKSIILRALGTRPEVNVAMWEQPFPTRQGDHFLLCSDGLSDLVDDEEIKQVIISSNSNAACARLIALAKERGGYDNITVGLVSIRPAGQKIEAHACEGREMRELEVVK